MGGSEKPSMVKDSCHLVKKVLLHFGERSNGSCPGCGSSVCLQKVEDSPLFQHIPFLSTEAFHALYCKELKGFPNNFHA